MFELEARLWDLCEIIVDLALFWSSIQLSTFFVLRVIE